MLQRRLFLAVLMAIFLCSIADVTANAVNTPLVISFSNKLPDNVIKDQKYEMSITWTNTNHKKSYNGYLQLSIFSNQRATNSSDITLTYNNEIIIPKTTGKTLQFQLPKQTFAPSTSGLLFVEVQHNAIGAYSWTIGIIRS